MPARLTRAELRRLYDAQLRTDTKDPLPLGVVVERDGPLHRTTGEAHGGFVEYRDLAGLRGPALDELIARQLRCFAARGEPFEWKLHAHDEPADLADRLRAAGFEPHERETVEIAHVADVAGPVELPDGVSLRAVHERADLARIAALERRVWGSDGSSLIADLSAEREAAPETLEILVAEAGGELVSAGWIRFPPRTAFATLWGGATLTEWRGRGIYRALVARRANLAAARGRTYLQVDASDASRPILERLGFRPVTTTTPFVWRPGT